MSQVEDKIKELGYTLPETPKPVAAYIPAVQSGNLVFTAGQIPFVKGTLKYTGTVGRDLSLEQGVECAEICCLNALAAIKGVIGDLDRITQIIKVTGFVQSTDNFYDQAKVMNGASELIGKIFGEKGKHARCALGTNTLPLNAPVEIDLIVSFK
jgi:enamine deaminase RidA (YjgF/YER057c/UK114 family)